MIQISGVNPEQISMLPLSLFERNIVIRMQNSPVTYQYDSLEALNFELKMRTSIVNAARALNASGADFASFKESECNEQFWTRTENGGFLLKRGVKSSDGINDIFQNGHLYAFECSAAIVIMLYKAILDVIHKQTFNANFKNLFLMGWNYDANLRLTKSRNIQDTFPGDILYFKNPDFDPDTPEWRGENVIMLADDLYFGHGVGIKTAMGMIDTLNKTRIPGSYLSAFLSDEVVRLDFEHIRKLHTRERGTAIRSGHFDDLVFAKVGTSYLRLQI